MQTNIGPDQLGNHEVVLVNTNGKVAIGFVAVMVAIVVLFVVLAIGMPAAAFDQVAGASAIRIGEKG